MPTVRISQIKREHVPKYGTHDSYPKPVYLSIFRSRAYTQSWKETEGEPLSIRRAKAFAHYLDTVPIFISSKALIVSFCTESPYALLYPIEQMHSSVLQDHIDGGEVKEEDLDEWCKYAEYWAKRSCGAIVDSYFTEEEREIAMAQQRYFEVIQARMASRTMPDHELYLEVGLNKIIETLHQKLDELYSAREECTEGPEGIEIVQKINDVKAMIIAAEAVVRWANRYSDLARKMAEEEKNPQRKEELMTISEICSWVPANPAHSFWGAVQSYWFCLMAYHLMEVLCQGVSARPDQIFLPWYEKDVLTDHTLPRERALEIIENLFILIDELGLPSHKVRRKSNVGNNYQATLTIGGVNTDGSDACNELTLLILDAIDDLRLNHPDFKFRWHPKVNPKVWRRCVEIVRSGLGYPSIKNDLVAIPTLMSQSGFTLEEARSWACVGCIVPAPTIHWGRIRRDAWSIHIAKFLELALNNGIDPIPWGGKVHQIGPQTGDAASFTSYDQVFEAFRKQIAWAIQKSTFMRAVGEYVNNEVLKRPFASCLFHRSLDACRDIMDCPEKGMPWFNARGIVDTLDSLISLKKLIFEDKKYTMVELLEALHADWEGYEVMRQDFINTVKFGNNDDFADEVAKQTYNMIAEEASKCTDINGVYSMPSGLIVAKMFLLAPYTGALPNGRKLGERLADGGCNPQAKFDRNGPMAAVLSASKLDLKKWKASIFNQKLTPASVEGEAGLRKFQNYIETAMHLGLEMIQFNVVDSATLKEAQKHPEQYQNLVVRVSGYNSYFVSLGKFVQDSIIERTEHSLV